MIGKDTLKQHLQKKKKIKIHERYERTNERTSERTNERASERANERASERASERTRLWVTLIRSLEDGPVHKRTRGPILIAGS